MDISDWFFLAIRWMHLLGAVAWVGGNIFFFLVLRPSMVGTTQEQVVSWIAGHEFRNLVDVSISILLITGVILAVSRTTTNYSTTIYGITLAIKIVLSIWMFYLVWFRQRRKATDDMPSVTNRHTPFSALARVFDANNLILIMGLVVLALADLLQTLYEQGITAS